MRPIPFRIRVFPAAFMLALVASAVAAQDGGIAAAASVPPAALAAATDAGPTLPANTVVELETVDAISSHSSLPGDLFRLRVAVDVRLGDAVVIPAGTPAMGQVVHAARAGIGGKSGELILAARYLELPQGRIALRSGFGAAGKDRTRASLATTLAVGMLGLLVRGRELELPAGSPLSARLAVAASFSPAR